jgi:exonuclease SbcC
VHEDGLADLGVEQDRINAVAITNFQSVEDAKINLGAWTVIVGKSNSGKSAVVRALRAVARNVNSPSSVRAGSKQFTATVSIGDTDVSIERGKSQSTYRVTDHGKGDEQVYTKAGRAVPEDVESTLNLPVHAGQDLTFATQLDAPYLLDASASTVAATLGDLSNVSRLHDASKEANRIRLASEATVKTRVADVTAIRAQIAEQFSTIRSDKSRVEEAKVLLDSVRTAAGEADRLEALLRDLAMTESALQQLQEFADSLPRPEDVHADVELVERDHKQALRLQNILAVISASSEAYTANDHEHRRFVEAVEALDAEYTDTLREAGTCPTCMQSTTTL